VAHACNPSYSGGRDQGIEVRNQPRQTVCKILSLKNPTQKRAVGVAQGVDPEIKSQYCKKSKVEVKRLYI
jgi:hypothetical protein